MIAKLILALRMWRHARLEKRAARLRFRANVVDARAEAMLDIVNQTLKRDGWQ